MPRIEPYEQRTSTPRPGRITIDTGAGAGLAAMGQALEQMQQNAMMVERADAAADAAQKLSDLRMRAAKNFATAQEQATDDASGFTPGMIEAFDRDLDDLAGQSKSKLSARILRDQAQAERVSLFEKSQIFEAHTRRNYRISSIEQSTQQASAAVELDPDSWQRAGAEQMAAIDAQLIPPEQRLQLKQNVDRAITEAAAVGYARRDPHAVLAELSNPQSSHPVFKTLSSAARNKIQTAATDTIVNAEASRILNVYERQGQDAGLQAMQELSNSDLPPLMRDDVRNKVNAGQSRLRDQRREESAQTLAGIETSIANDTAGRSTVLTVDELYDQGVYTPTEYASVLGRIERTAIDRAKNDAVASELREALTSGLPLDPRNPEHRKAQSQAFKQETRAFAVGSPDWLATASAYANRTRLLPEQATAWMRQGVRSPDPKLAAAAAQFYGAINASTPDAISEVDADTKSFAGTVNAMIEAGTPPEKAVETARTTVFDLKPDVVKRREVEYTQHAKRSDVVLEQLVDAEFDPGIFASPPIATVGMRADFEAQSQRYYAKVGDIALARKLAWDDLKRVYGPSKINSGLLDGASQMMALPPERFDVTPEEVRTDIGNFLKSNPQADGSTVDDVFVVSDGLTMRQVNDALDGHAVQPSYRLVTKSGDPVVNRDGVAIRYTIPTGEELAKRFRDAQAKAEAQAQATVDEARAQRQRERAERQTWQRAYPAGK